MHRTPWILHLLLLYYHFKSPPPYPWDKLYEVLVRVPSSFPRFTLLKPFWFLSCVASTSSALYCHRRAPPNSQISPSHRLLASNPLIRKLIFPPLYPRTPSSPRAHVHIMLVHSQAQSSCKRWGLTVGRRPPPPTHTHAHAHPSSATPQWRAESVGRAGAASWVVGVIKKENQ